MRDPFPGGLRGDDKGDGGFKTKNAENSDAHDWQAGNVQTSGGLFYRSLIDNATKKFKFKKN
ncbi:MAG: hypothetical protein HZA01_11445 [Nitrospinae bacterium]|nr:hypothetical protein [Nitrospinota bacterium]